MSPDPKVDSITEHLRQRITEGYYGIAGRLPPLRMLAEQYRTTNETMNKVIQLLQSEGVLFSQGRTGLFVHPPRTRVSGIALRFDLLLEQQGLKTVEDDIDKPEIVQASSQVAKALDVAEDTPVVRRFRRQGTATVPYRLAENFYPVDLAGGEILEQMQQDVHFDVLEAIRKTHHKVIKGVHEDIIARLPTTQEQELLSIVRTTPVVEMLRKSYSANDDGTVIMFSRFTFAAMFFEFSYDYQTTYWLNR